MFTESGLEWMDENGWDWRRWDGMGIGWDEVFLFGKNIGGK